MIATMTITAVQDEQLRRWSLSWQYIQGPFEEDDDIYGPIKLNYMNRVASVGSSSDLQLYIDKSDSSILSEHGMISYKKDQLLYVNSSNGPTKLNDQNVTSDDGPIKLNNGDILEIGKTKLVITSYMEFAQDE
jgi:hypothetical protein